VVGCLPLGRASTGNIGGGPVAAVASGSNIDIERAFWLSKPAEGMFMSLKIVGRHTVRAQLSWSLCIRAVRQAMIDLSAGITRQTLRQIIPIEDRGAFGVMQGALSCKAPFGAKILSVFPGNVERGGQSHQGIIVLFDADSGEPTHIVHAGEVTAIRTAAASAVATDALARADSEHLAILGSGEQAEMHARAICEVRPITRISLWARSTAKAQTLAVELEHSLARTVNVVHSVGAATRQADIICTTTAAHEPILHNDDVRDGTHVNVVGSAMLGPREIDDALVARSRFIADHRESVLRQGAEFVSAKAAGMVEDSHLLGEIGDVLSGALIGRQSEADVTIYKSLGNIVQDLASAALLTGLQNVPVASLED
jgi:ornithine cyclodeaminase/alanine dehydrogenase-like protein (mu-crystallin family)